MIENTLLNITSDSPVWRWENAKSGEILEAILDEIGAKDYVREAIKGVPEIPAIITDAYFIHYSMMPLLRDRVGDELMMRARDVFERYMDTSDYKHIHVMTRLDNNLSNLYRYTLAKKVIKEILDEAMRNPPQPRPNQSLSDALKESISNTARKLLSSNKDMSRILKSVAKSVRDTGEYVKAMNISAGKEPGTFEKVLKIHLHKQVDLRKLVNLARRLKIHIEGRIRMEPSPMGFVEGYRKTNKLEHVIARELALPDELFLAKLAGNGFTAWDKRLPRRGAYYVVIDKSGSMDGPKTEWARSVAMALFYKAQAEGAKYYLRFFDHEVYPDKPASDPAEVAELIATIGSDGGTSIDKALRTAIRDLETGKYDTETIILITDGEDRVSIRPEELKRVNARLVAVMIDGDNYRLRELAEESGGQYLAVEPTEKNALKLIEIV